jgi:hypothetical protein
MLLVFSTVPPTSSAAGLVAFHAHLSHDITHSLSVGHVLNFDVISLNRGLGYKAFDGIFIVPTSGTYVFTWSTTSSERGNVFTQLMKNSAAIGSIYSDSVGTGEWDSSTGTVVVDVTQGDHVYVRIGRATAGVVASDLYSRTTFSGWILN